jgi:hypothetical protein
MSGDYRHHRASCDVQIVLVPVEVPVAGSPKEAHRQPPPAYPINQRQPWRPPTRPPCRRVSKAEALRRLLDGIRRNDEAARAMMTPSPVLMKAWMERTTA